MFPNEPLYRPRQRFPDAPDDRLPLELEYKPSSSASHQPGTDALEPASACVPKPSADVLSLSARVPEEDALKSADVRRSGSLQSADVLEVSSGTCALNTQEGVWAKERLSPGIRYGPFKGELKKDAADQSKAWEVCVQTF